MLNVSLHENFFLINLLFKIDKNFKFDEESSFETRNIFFYSVKATL